MNGAPINGAVVYRSPSGSAMTAGGLISLTHGLGGQPDAGFIKLRCETADIGYSPGEWQWFPFGVDRADSIGRGLAIRDTSTQLLIRVSANGLLGGRTDNGGSQGISIGNWTLWAYAWRFI